MIDPQAAQDAMDPQAEMETCDAIDAVVAELEDVQADIQNQVDAAGVTDKVDLSGLDGVAQALTAISADEQQETISDMAQELLEALTPVQPGDLGIC
jgi:ABC-type xylose transport system substrate-binding protein